MKKIILAILLGFSATTLAHPKHAVMSVVTLNDARETLEVVHTLQMESVNEVYQSAHKKAFWTLSEREQVEWLKTWLPTQFLLMHDANFIQLNWVGHEVIANEVIVYQLMPYKAFESDIETISVQNFNADARFFIGIVPAEINTVLIEQGDKRRSLVFTEESDF